MKPITEFSFPQY